MAFSPAGDFIPDIACKTKAMTPSGSWGRKLLSGVIYLQAYKLTVPKILGRFGRIVLAQGFRKYIPSSVAFGVPTTGGPQIYLK
jgi:hypothetical protein